MPGESRIIRTELAEIGFEKIAREGGFASPADVEAAQVSMHPIGRLGSTLDIALGGIAEKPGVVDGRIEVREYLHVTVCFDHDIVDGAPAARFTARFKELVENGCGLEGFEARLCASLFGV